MLDMSPYRSSLVLLLNYFAFDIFYFYSRKKALIGSEIIVNGIVREFRVDEAYCLKMEEDNIQSHKTGETDESLFERKMGQIQFYRDSMATANTDHLSFYSVEYVAHQLKEEEVEEI